MINVNTVSKALFDQIKDDQDVINLKCLVQHGEWVNADPSKTPWIGVYRDGLELEPITLGKTDWKADPVLKVIVQSASLDSGEACQILLDDLLMKTNAAILKDLTFDGAVLITTSIKVQYTYLEDARETLYFQGAILTIETEARASV